MRIAVLADDLIWATRLADGVARAGGEPVGGPDRWPTLARPCPRSAACIVDLTARAYDGIDGDRGPRPRPPGPGRSPSGSTTTPTRAGAATDAGATRVYAYRALFEHGDRVLAAWLERRHAAGTEDPMTDRPRDRDPGRTRPPSGSTRARGEAPRRPGSTRCWSASAPTCATSPATTPMPLERLTLLVLPAGDGAPVTLVAPRLEATPARACAGGAAGA